MANVLREITSITDKDCFYIVERHKTEFTYPVHEHRDFELNFVEHAAGAQRVVGDSLEEMKELSRDEIDIAVSPEKDGEIMAIASANFRKWVKPLADDSYHEEPDDDEEDDDFDYGDGWAEKW